MRIVAIVIVVIIVALTGCRFGFDAVAPDDGRGGGGDVAVDDGGTPLPCVVSIGASTRHVCAVRNDGTVWCAGAGNVFQLGDGTTNDSATPVRALGIPLIRDVALGTSQTYALARDGSVWAWGRGSTRYELGNGMLVDISSPIQVPNLPAVVDEIASGESHVCVRSGVDVYCWGWNMEGQIGAGDAGDHPTAVMVLSNATQIAAGGRNTCALKTDKTVWCWGSNGQGQIGNGNNTNQNAPVMVPAFTAEEVRVGGRFTCARRSDGSVWCWGKDASGTLGDGGTQNQSVPVRVQNVANVTSLARAFGGRRTCAIDNAARVLCWGEAMYSSVGPVGPSTGTLAPSAVPDLAGASLLVAMSGFTCIRTAAGTLSCAGRNTSGQLGDGTMTTRQTLAPTLLACP